MIDAPPALALRIGTRASALAMVQARHVAACLEGRGVATTLVTITTDGDRRTPDTPWGEGAFVSAIEDALLHGSIDLAVHSAKDVPTDEDPRLRIAAFLPRADPDDVLVLPHGRRIAALDDLPMGTRVGTDSPRRTAFLRAARPDLRVHPLHGNVDTRLRRLDDGDTDALILAAAGLTRLGRADRISLALPTHLLPPAPGQGALAIQIRSDDRACAERVARLDDPDTRRSVVAERRLLAAAGGGCRAPLGALGLVRGGRLRLEAGIATPDGTIAVLARGSAVVGDAAAERALRDRVLRSLAERAAAAAERAGRPRVVVTRPTPGSAATVLALVDRGLAPVPVPTIRVDHGLPGSAAGLVEALRSADWVVLASANAVAGVLVAAADAGLDLVDGPGAAARRWAAVGPTVERALRAAGIDVAVRPAEATAAALAEAVPIHHGDRVVVPRGDLADDRLPARLAARGARVDAPLVYRTVVGPGASMRRFRDAMRRGPRAVLFTSGSTVRGWVDLARRAGMTGAARAIPAIAIGPSTAAEARLRGLSVVAVAAGPDPATAAQAVADAIHPTLEEA